MTALNKPVTRHTRANVIHGVKPELVVTLYPGGTLGLRERGRRRGTEVYLDIGMLYVRAVENRIAVERMNKGRKRAQDHEGIGTVEQLKRWDKAIRKPSD